MKRVLIITYYWPPSGGSGVQRWLKMSKYLPEFGWQPVIYTAKDAEYPVEDCSLEKDVNPDTEVLRNKIIEPYNLYKKFLGIKHEHKVKAGFISENESPSWKTNLSVWLRGNLFIPDARCLWIKPSVRFLKKYLKENPVDAIISTGPP
ncbi:MAG: glycosyl transferase family 1, partial [Bacteroidales bacterium]|nr:glycosyl transferase family 1 [Bacteroidales bacterium]